MKVPGRGLHRRKPKPCLYVGAARCFSECEFTSEASRSITIQPGRAPASQALRRAAARAAIASRRWLSTESITR